MTELPPAPRAPARPVTTEHFGDVRVDEWAWLRDRENPEVLEHLRAERAHAEAFVDTRTDKLRERLYRELRGRIKETDQSVPVREDDYLYYTRTEQDLEYPIHCRRLGSMDADEEVYLDENALAEGHEYFSLSSFAVTPDHKRLAYTLDLDGDEIHTIHFLDLESGEELEDRIEGAGTSLAWSADSSVLFYEILDEQHRPYRAFRHRMGTPAGEDALVYEESDEAFFLGLYETRSDKLIVISSSSQVTSEVRILPADDPCCEPHLIAPRETGVEYGVADGGDRLFIHTNADAKNFRLMSAPHDATSREQWTEVVAHRDEVLLEDVDVFANYLVLWERANGLRRLRVLVRGTDQSHVVSFPDPAYTLYGSSNPDFDATHYRFGYASMTRPHSTFEDNLTTRARVLLKQREVVGGHDPDAYCSERIFAEASDGTRVPISLVYRPGATGLEGPRPLLLYGYGAYGSTTEAGFSSGRLSLLDRGAVYAIAHVRGGEELGRHWYEQGKLEHKQNSFTDFIACAEKLIAAGYTSPDKLAAYGGSAGGLLIGAVANLRPDLFAALVADVPFVDVMTTMLDPTLPLTVIEYEEWGDPRVQADYERMRAYSPYDNVQASDYPAMLVLAGLNDPRVGYWEPAKWVQRLRALRTDPGPTLLWTNMEGGHAGASGRFEYLHEVALEYAFLVDRLGLPAELPKRG